MRKDALKVVLVTLVMGIFGAFFRWLQNINAFEDDTGLLIPGAKTTVVVVIYLVLSAVFFAALVLLYLKSWGKPTSPEQALRPTTVAPGLICKVCGVVTILASAALMLSAGGERYPMLMRLFAALGIFSGAALFFVMGNREGTQPGNKTAMLLPVLFMCMWLIYSYKNNAENPVIWAFVIEILTLVFTTMAWYELAAYYYGRSKPNWALFFVPAAAFMNITTLTDSRALLMSAMFAIQAVLMLMFEYLLVENLEESQVV
jgi:hypothetical protein